MDAATRHLIRQRAGNRCEYCHLYQDDDFFTFHIEHIIAKQHGGSERTENLCLSCRECNFTKGTNAAGYRNGKVVPLFNPRRQNWKRHFTWKGPLLVGKTLAGTVTVKLFNINEESPVLVRASLIEEGRFPPLDDPQE
jgi:5-methylcytosine-specific restriction endonuclease McrA